MIKFNENNRMLINKLLISYLKKKQKFATLHRLVQYHVTLLGSPLMDILVPPKLPIDCVNVVLFILEFDTRYDGEISVTLALFLFSDCR